MTGGSQSLGGPQQGSQSHQTADDRLAQHVAASEAGPVSKRDLSQDGVDAIALAVSRHLGELAGGREVRFRQRGLCC